MRLAGSGLNYKGRLEIRYGGHWGTVCEDYIFDSFDDNVAQVACYMLGFGYVRAKVIFSSVLVNINK